MQRCFIHRQKAKKTMQNALVSTLMSGNVAGCARDASLQPVPGEVPFGEILAKESAAASSKEDSAASTEPHEHAETSEEVDETSESMATNALRTGEEHTSWMVDGGDSDPRMGRSAGVTEIASNRSYNAYTAEPGSKAGSVEPHVAPREADPQNESGSTILEGLDPVSDNKAVPPSRVTSDASVSENSKYEQSIAGNWRSDRNNGTDGTAPMLGPSDSVGQAREAAFVATEGEPPASSIDTKEGPQASIQQQRFSGDAQYLTEAGPNPTESGRLGPRSANNPQVPEEVGLQNKMSLARPLSELSKGVDGATDLSSPFGQVSNDINPPYGNTDGIARSLLDSSQPHLKGASLIQKPTTRAREVGERSPEIRTMNSTSSAGSDQNLSVSMPEQNQESGVLTAPKLVDTGMKTDPTMTGDLSREQYQADSTGKKRNLAEMEYEESERRADIPKGKPETAQVGTARNALLSRAAFGNVESEVDSIEGVRRPNEMASEVPGMLTPPPASVYSSAVEQQSGQSDNRPMPELSVSLRRVTKGRDEPTSEPQTYDSVGTHTGKRSPASQDPLIMKPIQAPQSMDFSNGFLQQADDNALTNGSDDMLAELNDVRTEMSLERAPVQASGSTERGVGEAQMRSNVRYVASTLVERAVANSKGTLELRMSPEELGALRISFSQGDSGLAIVIQAERPETLDLFRRNIEQFTQDLKSLGYDDVSMSFEGGHEEGAGAGRGDGHGRSEFNQVTARSEAQPEQADSSDPVRNGLDLRL